jgi:C-terminal processing protease CtpA/Prc
MKTIFPLWFILLFVTLVVATPLVAAQKGFIGMQLDFKADPGGGMNLLNPTLMLGWVKYIVPKSPADGHNITVGDILLEIDGAPVAGLKLSALKSKMSVAPGVTIHLKLKRPNGEIYTADLTVIPKTW